MIKNIVFNKKTYYETGETKIVPDYRQGADQGFSANRAILIYLWENPDTNDTIATLSSTPNIGDPVRVFKNGYWMPAKTGIQKSNMTEEPEPGLFKSILNKLGKNR